VIRKNGRNSGAILPIFGSEMSIVSSDSTIVPRDVLLVLLQQARVAAPHGSDRRGEAEMSWVVKSAKGEE
jgi:hypothetical protein